MKKLFTICLISLSAITLSGCVFGAETIVNDVVKEPISKSVNASFHADVQNVVVAVNTYLVKYPTAPTIPTTGIDAVQINPSSPYTQIVITGKWDGYKVVGTDTLSGDTYTFDSQTGEYM